MVSKSRALARRLSILALALCASLALASVTAGSASALSVSLTKKTGASFFTEGGGATFKTLGVEEFPCQTSSGTGEYTSPTTGVITLTLRQCANRSGVSCTSPGQAKGTIAMATVPFQLVYLDAAKTKFGILMTPPASGVFASFNCSVFLNCVWKGNGLMGQITNPPLNVKSNQLTLSFAESAPYTQQFRQIEGTGTIYQLTESVNNGSATAMSLIATESGGYLEGIEGTFIP